MNVIHYMNYSSPLGEMTLGLFQNKLCFLSLNGLAGLKSWALKQGYTLVALKKLPTTLQSKLGRYFEGRLKDFSYPTIFLTGTPFEQRVWQALKEIPYGEVKSYAWLAKKVKSPQAVRAVGQANGKNCIPIVIPCHRVINSDKTLGGYSGGLGLKKKLLLLEGVQL